MNILTAIDSFKGSLSSLEAGEAIKEAAESVFDDVHVTIMPVADGGEGTVEAISGCVAAKKVRPEVTGPLFRPTASEYCILEKSGTAVIEMAAAAGLPLVPEKERNPLNTTTFGVGELIKDAIGRGCRNFIIGIGGSATNDGGIGMLGALGYAFLDADDHEIPLCANGLQFLHHISAENAMKELSECTFRVACDVKNPLCGENGCSAVFAPQKGAAEADIPKMDQWLKNYAEIASVGKADADCTYPGSGAAGGLGFAFRTFLNAELESGIDIILREIGLEDEVKKADIVITGEGRLDSQSVMGKTPIGVAKIAKKHGKTVLAFSGCVTDDAVVCNDCGIDAFFPILRNVTSREAALDRNNAYRNLKDTACQVFRLIRHFHS